MFALFFSLYLAMFRGTWLSYDSLTITTFMKEIGNALGQFFTSIFNNVNTPMSNLGDILFGVNSLTAIQIPNILILVSFVLALITTIGIVVMAVKGVKKAFGIFFMGIR